MRRLLDPFDVNASGDVTSLDALAVVNQLGRVDEPQLPGIVTLDDFGGSFFDVSGDGNISSIDALRVINESARRLLSREGELIWVFAPTTDPADLGDTVHAEPDEFSTIRKVPAFWGNDRNSTFDSPPDQVHESADAVFADPDALETIVDSVADPVKHRTQ